AASSADASGCGSAPSSSRWTACGASCKACPCTSGPISRKSTRLRRTAMAYEAQLAETVLIRGHRGDRIDAYLARPLGGGPHPGVVIIHHMPGWDGPNKEIARRFAHHGFVTILPNLHFREGKATPEENSASVRAAGDAFFAVDRPQYRQHAAVDGWKKVLAWLDKYLR